MPSLSEVSVSELMAATSDIDSVLKLWGIKTGSVVVLTPTRTYNVRALSRSPRPFAQYGSPEGTLGERKVRIAISFPRNTSSFPGNIISFPRIIISFPRIIISFPRNSKWLTIIRSNELLFRGNEIIFRENEILFRGNEIAILTSTSFFFLCPFRASVTQQNESKKKNRYRHSQALPCSHPNRRDPEYIKSLWPHLTQQYEYYAIQFEFK